MLRHTGITVNNEKKFLNFFKKLNFKVFKVSNECPDFMYKLHRIPKLNLVTYKLKSSNGGMIEILKFKNKFSKCRKNKIYTNGINHIALTLKNLDKEYNKLKKYVRFINKPHINPEGTAKVAFAYGPENLIIEFVEEL